MTQRFILDENVVILAQNRENDGGEPDPTCRDLLTQILDICHTIVVDPNLWSKYQQHLSSRSRADAQEDFHLIALLNSAFRLVADKVDFRPNAAIFPEEGTIPQGSRDDVVPVVRLAVETRAILVTTDGALRDDLNSCGVQERYGLEVLSPEDALDRL